MFEYYQQQLYLSTQFTQDRLKSQYPKEEVYMSDFSNLDFLTSAMEHTFWTWSAQGQVKPIPVEKAKGVYFWDTNGKRYLDFNSMTMCVNAGHGDERIINAMIDQLHQLPYAAPGMATRPRGELGKLLFDITPNGLDVFLFTLGGADANENAVKLARAYTGRHKILARYRSYHGATAGAMALTGDPRRHPWEPNLMPGVVHFLDPYRYRSTFHQHNPEISEAVFCQDYLNHLDEIIQLEGPETIAAVFLESITGTNGIIIPPAGYLPGVRKLCDKYDILMIADEVMSGFGRTGEWFAVNHWNISPDIMTMAKGLTSAYAPLGAVAISKNIADYFQDRVYQGGLTYNAHPVSLAAAIANIKVIQEDQLVGQSKKMGVILHQLLTELGEQHPCVGEVRNIGLFGAVELVKNRTTKEPMAPFNGSSPEMNRLRNTISEAGLFMYIHWNILLIIPPLIITEAQLEEGINIINQSLNLVDTNVEKY